MRGLLAAFILCGQLAPVAYSAAGPVVTLTLPHPLGEGEAAWLEVKVGAIPRGVQIEMSTTAGQFLGSISPFGIRSGQEAGTYSLPLPRSAVSGGHVSLRLCITQSGRAQRPPTADEVKRIAIKITRAAQ